jgi:hypothetical protein
MHKSTVVDKISAQLFQTNINIKVWQPKNILWLRNLSQQKEEYSVVPITECVLKLPVPIIDTRAEVEKELSYFSAYTRTYLLLLLSTARLIYSKIFSRCKLLMYKKSLGFF